MKIIRHIILIYGTFLALVSYGQSDMSKINSKKCFCDSIFKINQSDTLTEYLCFKETYIYKLQQKGGHEIISRVYPNHKQSDAESMVFYRNDFSKNAFSYFSLVPDKTGYLLTYIGEGIDSLEVLIVNKRDTLYLKRNKANEVFLSKEFVESSKNVITAQAIFYISEYHPGAGPTADNCGGTPGNTVTQGFIRGQLLPAETNYLLKYSLDKVLPMLKNCIDKATF